MGNAHLRIDVCENSWLHKEAVLVITLVQSVPSAAELCALAGANLHVLQIALQLLLIHCRTHICGLIEPIADSKFARALN